ncbi:MAG: hypothetical protein ACKVIN_06030 [Longimicrobiales bacterium]
MTHQIPWPRLLVEGVVIIASILAAFGIEAGWDARGERVRRSALMNDLRTELVRNGADLNTSLVAQRIRVQRIDLLLTELTPNAVGLAADSARALQASLVGVTSYDPSLGILDLLIQSGDLALLENRELRARLAGLSAVSEDYLSNQYLLVQTYLTPEVILGTGSILFDVSDVVPGDELSHDSVSGGKGHVRQISGVRSYDYGAHDWPGRGTPQRV